MGLDEREGGQDTHHTVLAGATNGFLNFESANSSLLNTPTVGVC